VYINIGNHSHNYGEKFCSALFSLLTNKKQIGSHYFFLKIQTKLGYQRKTQIIIIFKNKNYAGKCL